MRDSAYLDIIQNPHFCVFQLAEVLRFYGIEAGDVISPQMRQTLAE